MKPALPHAESTPLKRFGRLIRLEMTALIGVSIATVIPLRFGYAPLGLAPATLVDMYFYASLAIFGLFQLRYMQPVKTFATTNWAVYAGGLALMLLLLAEWFTGNFGRVLSFSNLEQGAVLSPIAFAISMPFVQGIVHIISTNSVMNMASVQSGT